MYELTDSTPAVSALCLHVSGTRCQLLAAKDSMLEHILILWPTIPQPRREAAYTLICEAGHGQS